MVVAVLLLLVLLAVYWSVDPSARTAGSVQGFANGGIGLGLVAAGEAVVVVAGGLDLSIGSILSLLNVILVSQMGASAGSQLGVSIEVLATGVAVSATNGLLVAGLNLPSILVTLSMSFLWQGVALLVRSQPGGTVQSGFASTLSGSFLISIPNSTYLLVAAVLVWWATKRTGWVRRLYALGSEAEAAPSSSRRVRSTIVAGHALAGLFYGAAALLLTAMSGSGDPNLGSTLVVTAIAAVVLGGTRLGGGRGDPLTAILGAFIVTSVDDILFAFQVPAFYTGVLNGAILFAAVLKGLVLDGGSGVGRWGSPAAPGASTPAAPQDGRA
ncbi:MAG TPA: ABC transporter permease [Acidimicrobiales bacterium]|nr:ABC transporter permease [Acidimicrobiales bacterium]